MSFVAPELAAPVEAFATALGIGLLVGMERERRPDSAAGLRTFALVSMLGCLFALLSEKTGGPWALIAGLVVISGAMVASNFSAKTEEQYRGFTSEAAVIVIYGLGAAVWFGYSTLAVMLAIATTILLYFKAELRRISERLTAKDINSILQFAVLSLVILPILPNHDFGPYNAINPRQVWWMVVLISGLALGGYMALRIIGTRHGATLLGIFGGLASSTATTMMFSRHAQTHGNLVRMSAIVILIANVMVMIRLGLVGAVVAPHLGHRLRLRHRAGRRHVALRLEGAERGRRPADARGQEPDRTADRHFLRPALCRRAARFRLAGGCRRQQGPLFRRPGLRPDRCRCQRAVHAAVGQPRKNPCRRSRDCSHPGADGQPGSQDR
ncbi:MAG: MgtC/SapB family protein, partial [Azonexus sp.]